MLPDPRTEPTVPVPRAARALGCSPATLYRAIAAGDSPVPIIRIGTRVTVPVAPLLELLGQDDATDDDTEEDDDDATDEDATAEVATDDGEDPP